MHRRSYPPTRSLRAAAVMLLTAGLIHMPVSPAVASPPRVLVTSVTDGDSIKVLLKGRTRRVRLIGVDTPETVHPSEPVECFGPEASSFTRSRLDGERVRLEFDEERRDQYGRLLAYVWKKGNLFNRTLAAKGYAQVTIYLPNDKHEAELRAAESQAKSAGRGMWGACGTEAAPPPTQPVTPPSSSCDPSYPDVCIPPPPPDLDCGEISHRNFRVTGSDPHGFDGNNDGYGCET